MGTSPAGARSTRGALGPALLVGALLCCLYLLSYSSVFRLDDEHILTARAQSLALRGTLDEPQVYGNLRVRELAGMGDQATQIEPLQTILSAALYRGAIALGLGGAQAGFLLNLYLTAFSAGMLTLTIALLGFTQATARWCGLFFGAGTIAWVYATSLVRDTPAMAAVSVALFGVALALRSTGRRRAVGIVLVPLGLLLGALAKNTVVAFGFGFALGIFAVTAARLRTERSARRWAVGACILLFLLFLGWAQVPAAGPLARYSIAYYRSLLGHFVGSLDLRLVGATLGPFLSPAKSVFLFSPPLFLAVFGVRRSERRVAVPIVAGTFVLVLAQALFYRERWAGSIGWGLRYTLPALPGLLVLAAPAVERLRSSRGGKAGLLVILGGSMFIQAAGVWADWRGVYAAWRAQGLNVALPSAAWDPRFLAIPGQLSRLFEPADWLPIWWRLRTSPGVVWAAGATAVLGLLLLVLLTPLGQRLGRRAARVAGACLIVAAGVFPVFPTLWVARGDPHFGGDRPEFSQALAAWEADGREGDLVVVDSYGTPLWAHMLNRWSTPVAWYSLPFEIPGSTALQALPAGELGEASLELFGKLRFSRERLWYFGSSEAPDYGLRREPAWLDSHLTLVERRALSGLSVVDLRIYTRREP